MAKRKTDAPASEWVALREASELTGKPQNTIKYHRGRIRHKKTGYGPCGRLYFDKKSLLEWAQAYELVNG